MNFEIKSRYNGNVLFAIETESLPLCVEAAIKSRANLSGAYLSGADLSGAYLAGANLSGADNADLIIAQTRILPEGTLLGWKKCCGNKIVKLEIPAKAKRSHAFGRKCRAEFVKVLEVVGGGTATSTYDSNVIYVKGKTVRCDKWNSDFQVECGGGIHFYITRAEAEAHEA
jgi:hypothetical protein